MTGQQPAQAPHFASSFPSQCLSEFLSRLGRVDPHPAVLDLGVLCGGNIAFLGSRGCRVSVESLPAAAPPIAQKADAQPAHPHRLSYPSGSFAGVLAWDAIAMLPSAEATPFVESLREMLLWGGVILAYFPGASGRGNASGRYRIVSEGRLTLEPGSAARVLPKIYENREIYTLFSRMDVVRFSQLKSGAREVLVARSRQSVKS